MFTIFLCYNINPQHTKYYMLIAWVKGETIKNSYRCALMLQICIRPLLGPDKQMHKITNNRSLVSGETMLHLCRENECCSEKCYPIDRSTKIRKCETKMENTQRGNKKSELEENECLTFAYFTQKTLNFYKQVSSSEVSYITLASMVLSGQRSSQTCQNAASVRRFSSYNLLKTSSMTVSDTSDEVIWYKYTSTAIQDFSMAIRHLSGKVKPEQLFGFNNTELNADINTVEGVWPSEEILAHYCLTHSDMFRDKSICELGGGMTCLAGIATAINSEAKYVEVSDGNEESVDSDRILSVTVSFENMVYEDALTILSYASPYPVKVTLQKEKVHKDCRISSTPNHLSHPLYRSQSVDTLLKLGKEPLFQPKRRFSEMKPETKNNFSKSKLNGDLQTSVERDKLQTSFDGSITPKSGQGQSIELSEVTVHNVDDIKNENRNGESGKDLVPKVTVNDNKVELSSTAVEFAELFDKLNEQDKLDMLRLSYEDPNSNIDNSQVIVPAETSFIESSQSAGNNSTLTNSDLDLKSVPIKPERRKKKSSSNSSVSSADESLSSPSTPRHMPPPDDVLEEDVIFTSISVVC
ncbi:hypothetical protein KUTeg_013671 [Tegillarca granosa]|uniref:Calmodulin-lysine N-methyltransferase n=1 Tax=Tegillarca granosa TaxID=220873 RepID=A0ABQ9EUD2_TEGGR|nr:hypothetical protein KUTeg_013671 [Tegillarca granosa]